MKCYVRMLTELILTDIGKYMNEPLLAKWVF